MNFAARYIFCTLFLGVITASYGMEQSQKALLVRKDPYPTLSPFITMRMEDQNREQPDFSLSKQVYGHMGTLRDLTEDTSAAQSALLPLSIQQWQDFEATVKPILAKTPLAPTKQEVYRATDALQRSFLSYFAKKPNVIAYMVSSLKAANFLDCPLWLQAITSALALPLTQSPTLLENTLNSENLDTLLDLPLEVKEQLVSNILDTRQGAVELAYMPDTVPTQTKEIPVPATEYVNSSVFNRAGDNIFVASNAGTVQQWEVQSGKLLHTFNALEQKSINEKQMGYGVMALSSDDTFLVTSGDSNTIKIWDMDSKKVKRTLTGHEDSLRKVTCNAENTLIASASDDGTIRLWDIESGNTIRVLHNKHTKVWTIAFSPDSKYVASGSQDGIVCIWDIATGNCLKQVKSQDEYASDQLQFSADGSRLVSRSRWKNIFICNIGNAGIINITGKSPFVSFQLSTDGLLVRTMSLDGTINLWDAIDGSHVRGITNTVGQDSAVGTFSASGTSLATYKGKGNPLMVQSLYKPIINVNEMNELQPLEHVLPRTVSLEQALLTTYAYQKNMAKQSAEVCDKTESGQLLDAYNTLPAPLKRVNPHLQVSRSLLCKLKALLTKTPANQ